MLEKLIRLFQRNLNTHIILEHEKNVFYKIVHQATKLSSSFNKKLIKENFEKVDDYMFLELIPQLLRTCVIADWLYSKSDPRREDFMRQIIYPAVCMLLSHFIYFNREDILKKAKLDEGAKVFKCELLPMYRYLWESPDSIYKEESLNRLKEFAANWRTEICSG